MVILKFPSKRWLKIKLMRDTVKDDEIMLPCTYPPEWEHHLSSIFVEAETPMVNHIRKHPPHASIFLHVYGSNFPPSSISVFLDGQGRYGTRS